MPGVRPFREDDIDAVSPVLMSAFGHASEMTTDLREHYRVWLRAVYLDNPMRADDLPSLVYESDGGILGFIGVVPRRFTLDGRSYRGTVNSNWAVHPKVKGQGVGGALFRAYLDLPRDLALNDEVMDAARAVEDRIGVSTSPFHSVRWVLPLRPAARMEQLVGNRLPSVAGWVTRPGARLLDLAMRSVPRSPFRIPKPDLHETPIDAGQLGDLIRDFGSPADLRPVTTDGSIEWLVHRARAMTQHGELRMVSLRGGDGERAGWYVYYAKPGGQGEVLQLVATRQRAQDVVDHLANDALSRGTVSISGLLHPDLLSALVGRRIVFEPVTRWMLIHSTRPELLEAFWRGRLLLSRLDGEWCHHVW